MAKLQFTNGKHSTYGAAGFHLTSEHWTLWLTHGLSLMPANFVCEICEMCKGYTRNREGYGCSYCEGTGLTQGFGFAATDSMRNQVLVAASRSLLVDGVVVK